MLSNNPSELKTPQSGTTKAGTAEESVPLLGAENVIETASTGNGSANDPGGIDTKPPGVSDFERFV